MPGKAGRRKLFPEPLFLREEEILITQVDTNLYRGPRPESMDELVKLGVKTIVNLEEGWFEFFHGKTDQEKRQASNAQIIFWHEPISDFFAPKSTYLRAIDLYILASQQHGPVYIHCLHGQDRTGLVCAHYRVKVQGWDIEKAIQEMYDMGFHKFPYLYLGWVNRLREAARC